jgi:hypothetical protein
MQEGAALGAEQRIKRFAVRDAPSAGRTGQQAECTAVAGAGISDGEAKATTIGSGLGTIFRSPWWS